jgi:NADPH2:quinone reductase
VPNQDGAGEIDAIGPDVPAARLGERVWVMMAAHTSSYGTAAEYCVVPSEHAVRLPDGVDFELGAGLGVPAVTAHRCLLADGPIDGKTILVAGGAGAVGHYAVQLAKWAGATVIATVSAAEKAAHATAGGADHVIDYRREDVAARVLEITGGTGVDHVVEVDFGGNLAIDINVVRNNGSIAVYASAGDRTPVVPIYDLMRRNIAVHTVFLASSPPEARRRAQSDITGWLKGGARRLTVAGRYPLRHTARAHQAVEAGGKQGTVIVEIDV